MSVLPLVSVGLALVGIILLALLVTGFRALHVSSRPGSFPTWVLDPSGPRWIRGVASYGQTGMRWSRLWDFPFRSPVVLPRHEIDVIEVPTAWHGSDLLTVRLRVQDHTYSVALSPGDASGLIAWLDSAAPGQ